MGYYTWFEIGVQENKGKYKVDDIIQYMKNEFDKNDKFYPFEYAMENDEGNESDASYFGLNCDESSKWYEHDEEMLEMSKAFPEIVFYLHGEGEESGDLWFTYYKNGKKQYCPARIEFDEYDESKLT